MKKLIKLFELVVSLLISGGFIYLFYRVIGFDTLAKFFHSLNPVNILVAFVLYLLSYITRTVRWRLTLKIKDFFVLFKLTVYNTVFNIFLPFRTGEFSFFYMLKKQGYSLAESLTSFFTVRIFDAYALLVVFGFAFLLLKFGASLALLFFLLSPVGIFFLAYISKFIKLKKLQEFRQEALHTKNIIILYVLSVLTLILKFSAFYLILPRGVNLSFSELLFAAAAGDLTTILPIHGIAGIGTYEGGFAGVLILLGVDKKLALLASVFVHLFILLASAILAAVVKIVDLFYRPKA